jgi:hypothetical protein
MAERFAKSRRSVLAERPSGAERPRPPARLDRLAWLFSLALSGAGAGCTTYRAYSGDAREPNKIAVLDCDPEGVVVRRVESYPFDGGWSEFELLPGARKVSAELFWTRLEKRVELPEKSTTFVAKAGERYRCVFDVNEQTHDWALAVVPESQVSWKSRTFHGARSWRTPSGDCLIWDPKQRGCLGDAAKQSDPAQPRTEELAPEIGPERP